MSVATDLQQIAENVPLVYAAGKRDQKDEFWEAFQDGGNRTNYQYGFAGNGFTDEILHPKYQIPTISENNDGRYMFVYNSVVTAITFPLSFSATINQGVFSNATNLVTISSLTVTQNVAFTSWFQRCSSLQNLTFGGTIGNSIDLSACVVLSVTSAKSVLSHLSASGSDKTVTFASAIQSAVEADEEATTLITTAQANGWTISFS